MRKILIVGQRRFCHDSLNLIGGHPQRPPTLAPRVFPAERCPAPLLPRNCLVNEPATVVGASVWFCRPVSKTERMVGTRPASSSSLKYRHTDRPRVTRTSTRSRIASSRTATSTTFSHPASRLPTRPRVRVLSSAHFSGLTFVWRKHRNYLPTSISGCCWASGRNINSSLRH